MDQTSERQIAFQKKKYNEVIATLLNAGYYRVQVHTLTDFDKVVGGLCWCITSSGEDIDVDILFQENSTIGQKIALTEAVVLALRKMSCPHPLQPHQIQGGVGHLLDYSAIQLVITWLIEKSVEYKEKYKIQMEVISSYQFTKTYQETNETPSSLSESNQIERLINKRKIVRKFKGAPLADESEDTRVLACLLEYGDTLRPTSNIQPVKASNLATSSTIGATRLVSIIKDTDGSDLSDKVIRISLNDVQQPYRPRDLAIHSQNNHFGSDSTSQTYSEASTVPVGKTSNSKPSLTGFEKLLVEATKESEQENNFLAEKLKQTEKSWIQSRSVIENTAQVVVSGSHVGAIISQHVDEISQSTIQYTNGTQNAKNNGATFQILQKSKQIANYQKHKHALEQQSQLLAQTLENLQQVVVRSTTEYEQARNDYKTIYEKTEQLNDKLNELIQLETKHSPAQQKDMEELKKLIMLNEKLKVDEAKFKSSCKVQRQELLEKINVLETRSDASSLDENEEKKMKEIEEVHFKISAKYNKLRKLLADANLEISASARVIDDTPTRSELIQYERRFIELNQQMEWKLAETKKYFAIYSMLKVSLSFLQKQVKQLNMISESFAAALKSAYTRMEFTQKFDGIIKEVQESVAQQEVIAGEKSKQVDECKALHHELVEEQLRYYKALKDFQEECDKNEFLTSQFEQLTQEVRGDSRLSSS